MAGSELHRWKQVRRQKGTIFSSPFTLLSQFRHSLISLQWQSQKMPLTVFLLTFFSLPREHAVILALGNPCHLRGKATFPSLAPAPRFSLCHMTVCTRDAPPGLLITEHHIRLWQVWPGRKTKRKEGGSIWSGSNSIVTCWMAHSALTALEGSKIQTGISQGSLHTPKLIWGSRSL